MDFIFINKIYHVMSLRYLNNVSADLLCFDYNVAIFTLIPINLAHFCYGCYKFYKIYALSNKIVSLFLFLLYFERVLHITVFSALSEFDNLNL